MVRITALLLFVSSFVFASTKIKSDSVETVLEQATLLAKDYGSANVLVVFDIDNVLLRDKQDLATEHFFDWQEKLLPKDPKNRMPNPLRLACTFPELLKLEGIALSLSETNA